MVLNENKLFFAVNNVLYVLAREKLPGLNILFKMHQFRALVRFLES